MTTYQLTPLSARCISTDITFNGVFIYSAPSGRSEESLFPTYDVPRPVRLTSHYEVPPSPLPLHPSPATRQYKLQTTFSTYFLYQAKEQGSFLKMFYCQKTGITCNDMNKKI